MKLKLFGWVWLMVAVLAIPTISSAKGVGHVANTIHNLSTSAPLDQFGFVSQYKSDNESEICIFCHTPHGGNTQGPLWNRSLPGAGSFTHYNSATISNYLQGLSVTRAVNDESLLCLSCHDGTIAVNHVLNQNNVTGPPTIAGGDQPIVTDFFGVPNPAYIGTNLSDDHPISFSYNSVRTEYEDVLSTRKGQLKDVATATNGGNGVRFFGGAQSRVECSSCHDPHVDYSAGSGQEAYAPFLIMPNTGSQLCLACHNK